MTDGTLLLYLVTGTGVGAALAWRDAPRWALWMTLGVAFWPVFLPLLWAPPRGDRPPGTDELAPLREEVAGLTRANPELEPLGRALRQAQATRRAAEELARLLKQRQCEFAADEPAVARNARAQEAREARAADLERIRAARDEQEARYLGLIARVREIVTLAHLARYSEPSRAELAKQLGRIRDESEILGAPVRDR